MLERSAPVAPRQSLHAERCPTNTEFQCPPWTGHARPCDNRAMPDTPLPQIRPLSAADHERAMSEYGRRAEARAYALGNRGPIRIGADGKLLPEILESYWTNGFYVFQGVVGPEE